MEAFFVLLICTTSAMTVMRQKRKELRLRNQYPDLNGNYLVPYIFNGTYSPEERSMVSAVMEKIAANTCVKFKFRTDEEDFVEVVRDELCLASAGRIREKIHLKSNKDADCVNAKSVVEMLLHELGLSDEHQRMDGGVRDKYIKTHFNDIPERWIRIALMRGLIKHRFIPAFHRSTIMHFAKKLHAKPGKITLKTVDPAYQVKEMTTEPSVRDYEKINKLYQCNTS